MIPSDEPNDVASSSSMAPELPSLRSVDTPMLIVLLILSKVLSSLAVEAIDADVVLGPITGAHAIVVEVLLKKFLALLKGVVSPLL